MTEKKKYKFRANVKQYNDADYLNKLSDEEKSWYEEFTNEYYSNAIGKDGGIHQTNLSPEDFVKAKKETYGATNAQNRDTYAIASCSKNYLKFIDDDGNFLEPIANANTITKLADPEYAFTVFLEQTIDELQSSVSRDIETVLTEFAIELVKLGASLRKDKVNSTLKRQKYKKDNKDEK